MLQKLAESEVKIDKYTKEYKTIRFMDTRTIKEINANIWATDYPSIFNAEIGTSFPGAIVTKDVMPYHIVDEDTSETKTHNKYTAVVIGDTSETFFFQELIELKFLRDKKTIIKSPIVSRKPEPKPENSSANPVITPAIEGAQSEGQGYSALANGAPVATEVKTEANA